MNGSNLLHAFFGVGEGLAYEQVENVHGEA
jgi:hypothetical protein